MIFKRLMIYKPKYIILAAFILLISCKEKPFVPMREAIILNGQWQFALDTAQAGIAERWFDRNLSEEVTLPGTLDENTKGIPNANRHETMRLSRELMYEGMAWYRREVTIPEGWNGKFIRLIMERTKPAQVWVDTVFAGKSDNILTEQVYDLSSLMTPGKHTLTIMVNNGAGSVPRGVTGSHAWTEHTQSNWNGIIGNFCLEAANVVHIDKLQVYPDIEKKEITVRLKINRQGENNENAKILMNASSWNSEKKHNVAARSFAVKLNHGENLVEIKYKMGRRFLKWSEFDPALYRLHVTLKGKEVFDNAELDFGMRKLAASGTQFSINGIKTFLRGKHDACVFPLTGHPPMDVEAWRKVFRIAKSYSINFYRFHSWTPPRAAFIAADIEGIYMQPELPFWGGFRKDRNTDLNEFLLKEGENILEAYGNHASFVMFALGNELNGDIDVMRDFVSHFKSIDDRPMYSFGTNNYLGFRGQVEGEDYYTGCRVGADRDTTFSTHIRGSFSFADTYDGGYINSRYPSTDLNYAGAIAKCTIPVLGTEVGQYQIYPNYDEIEKYTGVMKPWNLMEFRDRLAVNSLGDQAKEFFRASGALSAICYKADIELALRTPGFGGFHLLDLQDFPGQGTALIGLLDAFMDSKGVITPEEFSHFCNKVVPLALMEKYCWVNNEPFKGRIQVANYSEKALKAQVVKWELRNSGGEIIGGDMVKTDIPNGKLNDIGTFTIDNSKIDKAERLSFTISLEGTGYKNSWPVWVYPAGTAQEAPQGITISERPDKETIGKLEGGETVLLFPDFKDIAGLSVGGLFTPDYWNYRMFKGISENNKKPVSPGTMSILTDPRHPLFNDFPTEFYTNWQWWPIVKNSRPFILDNTPADYRPIVQVVDNIERNHKLGLIFEFKVGKGKLLVCMSQLKAIQDKPEGRQLYGSILKYISSDKFNPSQAITSKDLVTLFTKKVETGRMTGVKNISYN
jgi:hypothetical protein